MSRLPRQVVILLHSASALIWLGGFVFYLRVWLEPWDLRGHLAGNVDAVTGGVAAAPFQYRILVPYVMDWMHESLGWNYFAAEMIVDFIALAIGVTAIHLILRRLEIEQWLPLVALVGSFIQIGNMWWGKTETYAAFGAGSVALWALLRDEKSRWLPLGLAAVVLAGTRSDLLIALGIASVARWVFTGRELRDLIAGVSLAAVGVASTIAFKLAYPDANYDENVGLFRISYNLELTHLLVTAMFLIPIFGPFLLWRSQPELRTIVWSERRWLVPVIALCIAQIGAVLVVGQADEIRLFFPIAGALAMVAIAGWSAVLQIPLRPKQRKDVVEAT